MQRIDFIKVCGFACVGLGTAAFLFDGCVPVKYFQSTLENNFLTVPSSEFEIHKKDKTQFRKYVIVRNEKIDFPVCLYRINEKEYHALLLKCTHQSAELSVNGDILTCSAHGSEFSNSGKVITGPAETSLVSYPVTIENYQIKIKTA